MKGVHPCSLSHDKSSSVNINSLYTRGHRSGPTTHNAFVLWTAYVVRVFTNLRQIGHKVCTKQMVLSPFCNLLLVRVYLQFTCSLCFRLACCIFSDWPSSACHSLSINNTLFHHYVNCLNIKWMISNLYILWISLQKLHCEKFMCLCTFLFYFFFKTFFLLILTNSQCTGKIRVENWQYRVG